MTLAPRRPLGKMADDPLAAMAAYVEDYAARRRSAAAAAMARRCAYCGGPEPVLPTRTCPGCGASEWER